jgi:short-subunit dehydrogenase
MIGPDTIALVTGASSGIGEAFVRRLAPRCARIIAVARRGERLQALAGELAGGALIEPLVADLGTVEGQTRAVEALRQRGPVRLLVNNAGFGTFGPFMDSAIERELAMLRLHQEATLVLSRAALPFMRDAGGGAIVNVSSIGAFLPMPNTAVYGASKAFLNTFSLSLQAEVARHGIRVQSLCPGLTRTEIHDLEDMAAFDKTRVPEALWMTAEEVVDASLAALGSSQVVLVPGAENRARVSAALEAQRASIDQEAT